LHINQVSSLFIKQPNTDRNISSHAMHKFEEVSAYT